MELPRRSGLLLHVTSLPGGPYTGDLGPSAYAFADFLEEAGQSWWQTLPVNPIGKGNSPYSSIASFATEPLMISPELLVKDGLLAASSLDGLPTTSADWKASFELSRTVRSRLLQEAHGAFLADRAAWSDSLAEFREREREWLYDYCLFAAFYEQFGTGDWTTWPKEIASREPEALRDARERLDESIDYLTFEQFMFDRQWRALKGYCNEKGIGFIGDIPMFVSHQGADVWAHQDAFLLRDDGYPEFVAGAPPDAFAADGQRWGNALYDWEVHEATGFAWWVARIRRQLELFDVVRLDHFIGFRRYWRIPSESKTAMGGSWIQAPGEALFDTLTDVFGRLPLIAEDLGSVSEDVWDLRDRYHLPGMKVLQFGFGPFGSDVHRPDCYPPGSAAYTGTHDSDTTQSWYEANQQRATAGDPNAQAELSHIREYLEITDDSEVVQAAIRVLSESRANTIIVPVQDILGLDGSHRMNTPGTNTNNWTWRLKSGELDADLGRELRSLTEETNRLPGTG